MDVFELTKKVKTIEFFQNSSHFQTLLAVISESSSSDDYLEALAEIEGLVKHEAAATVRKTPIFSQKTSKFQSFQLMERGKVRELAVPKPEFYNKRRKFEDFQEKTVFDWKSEFNLKNAKKVERWTVEEKEKREKQRCFIEVYYFLLKKCLKNDYFPGKREELT